MFVHPISIHLIPDIVALCPSHPPPTCRCLSSFLPSAQGAEDALSCGAVGVCTTLLASSHAETVVEAARTLGFLCSHESGKHEALFDVGQVIEREEGSGD